MASIVLIRPVSRNAGIQVPNLINAAEWVDCLVLTGGAAKSYALPTDAAGSKGTVLGISATGGPIYINADATAVIPVADNTSGTAPSMLHTDNGFSYLVAVADSSEALSFISAANAIVYIEVWK